jgi:hypothetical protein
VRNPGAGDIKTHRWPKSRKRDRGFANPDAAYLHLHYAAAGFYAASVERA